MPIKGCRISNRFSNGEVSYLLAVALAFILPFNFYFIPTLLIILLSVGFIEAFYYRKLLTRPNTSLIVYGGISAVHFLHLFIITIFSENVQYGASKLETKLPLLLFAMFFLVSLEQFKRRKQITLVSVVLGSIIASLTCLVIAFIKSVKFDGTIISFNTCALPGSYSDYPFLYLFQRGWSYFSYGFLSVFNHPSYFSIYLVFSLSILLVFKQQFTLLLKGKSNFLFYATVGLLILTLILLQSKANIIALFSILIYFVILKWKKLNAILKVLIIISIVSTIAIMALKTRFVKVVELFEKSQLTELAQNKNTYEGTALRVFIWRASWEVIQDNFWFGVGLGDTKQVLQKKYKEKGLKYAEKWELNTHNQFLESFLEGGVIGLVLLLMLLIAPLIEAIKSKNILFIAFMMIVTINLLFESFFYRQSGILFYSFFVGLLYLENSKQQISFNK